MTRKYKITLEITEEVTVLKGEEKGRKVELSTAIEPWSTTDKKGLYDLLDECLPHLEAPFQKSRKDFEEGKLKVGAKTVI